MYHVAGQNLHSSNANFDSQNLSNVNANREIYYQSDSLNIMHWFRSIKMIVRICYFLKSVKSMFILVQCNTSLSIILHIRPTVVCVIGWIWEKTGLSAPLAHHAYEISRRIRIFHEFIIDNNALKTFVKFWVRWKRSKFEHCRIRSRTVTSLISWLISLLQ